MKLFILTLASLLAGMSVFSQIQVIPLKEAKKPMDGVVYTLPKTKLVIEVELQKVVETPGLYAPYAERFLGLTNVQQVEKTTYKLINVRIFPKAIPDNPHSFLVMTSPKNKRSVSVELTPEGFLRSFNGKINKTNTEKKNKTNVVSQTSGKDFESMEASVITREMQQSSSTTKIAELAATQLFNLRDNRMSLLSQETENTPSDGRSYELVLSEINRLERYYTELFTGKRAVTTQTSRFEFEPKKEEEAVLFRFSQQLGILDKSDLGGSPILIKVSKKPGPTFDSIKEDKEKKPAVIGLYYRIPGTANISISDDKTVFCEKSITVAQFGSILTLPSEVVWRIELCPVTGALLKAGN